MTTMRELFAHHHRLSDGDRSALLRDCLFAFDTNALLNIYRYAQTTREDLFRVLKALKNRLWIPYQVAKEFYKNRVDVILEQRSKYQLLSEHLDHTLKGINDADFKRSGFLQLEEVEGLLSPAIEKAKQLLDLQHKKHPDLIREDPYLDILVKIVGSAVGPAPTSDILEKWSTDAQIRIDQQRPPGYRDAKKPVPERFGDVFIWYELLQEGERRKCPITFVTDDDKDDWWQVIGGEKIGARPELRAEMRAKAGQDFYICRPAYLLEVISKELTVKVADSSIDDAKKIAAQTSERAEERGRDRTAAYRDFVSRTHSRFDIERGNLAEHAVGMWLLRRFPSANVIPHHVGWDFIVDGSEGRIGVDVHTIRHATLPFPRRFMREVALRGYYERSQGKLDTYMTVLVADSSIQAFEVAERVSAHPPEDPPLAISVGFLTDARQYEEVWGLPMPFGPPGER